MSSTFTATANSNTTIGYVWYGSTEWEVGSSNGACQGAYMSTSASQSRVGLMLFSGAGATLKGKIIQSITLSITCSGAGSGSSSKVLSFRRANVQVFDKSLRGSAQVGAALGTLTGKFYSNTTTHTLSASSNAAFFKALSAYLTEGNSALVLYNGETSKSDGYSTNYARVTSCTLTVSYIDAAVWYRDGGEWKQCTVWYRSGGAWVQVAPYYRKDGAWVRV
mgnify:FL=1